MERIDALLAEQGQRMAEARRRGGRNTRVALVAIPIVLIVVLVPGLIWLDHKAGSPAPASSSHSLATENLTSAVTIAGDWYRSHGDTFAGAAAVMPGGSGFAFVALSTSAGSVSTFSPEGSALVLSVYQGAPAAIECIGAVLVEGREGVAVEAGFDETARPGTWYFDAPTTDAGSCDAEFVQPRAVAAGHVPGG